MLYVVRHGETRWNTENRIQGQRDIPLSDRGREQCAFLTRRFENTALTQIIHDRRALLTSRAISMNPDLIPDWVRAQNERAADYLAHAHEAVHGARADNFTKAIDLYRETLDQLDPETWPQEWAITNFELAKAYWTDMPGDRGIVSWVTRDQAIVHFHAALLVWTRDSYPAKWAETQAMLGLTYLSRRRGDRWDNIEEAIQYFENAF